MSNLPPIAPTLVSPSSEAKILAYKKLISDNLGFIEGCCSKFYNSRHKEYTSAADQNAIDELYLLVLDHMQAADYKVLRLYDGSSNIRSYLATVITRKAIDLYRKKNGRLQLKTPEENCDITDNLKKIIKMSAKQSTKEIYEKLTDRLDEAVSFEEMECKLELLGFQQQMHVAEVEHFEEQLTPGKSDQSGQEKELQRKEQKKAIATLMTGISNTDQLLLTMRYIDQISPVELAKIFKCNERKISNKLYYLSKQMRKKAMQAGIKIHDLL